MSLNPAHRFCMPHDRLSPNQATSHRALVLRAASLTALFYFGILIVPFIVAYYYKPAAFTLSKFLQLPFLSIGVGILVGILVIWLVFPRTYASQESHEFFPKILWVGGWHLVIFPPLYFVLAGINPFDLNHIQDIIGDPQFLTDSPILNALAIANIFAFLTYSIFFSALKFWYKKQMTKPTPATTT